jgi:hypothetical protein
MEKLIEENDSISRDLNDSFANLLESSPGSSETFTTPRIEEEDTFKSTIAAPDKDATKPLPEVRRGFLAQKNVGDSYIKTTSMANLYYYRKSASRGNLTSSAPPPLDEDKTYDHHSS